MPSLRLLSSMALVAVLALAAAGGWWQARRLAAAQAAVSQAAAERAALHATLARLRAELDAARDTPTLITRYVDRVQHVQAAAHAIRQEIPAHVTPAADAACPVPAGFVRIHDAAAAGLPAPDPAAGDPDAPAPGLALSTVADTVADNYATCHAITEQLTALQDWARRQAATEQQPGTAAADAMVTR
jgi:hypothetical protein